MANKKSLAAKRRWAKRSPLERALIGRKISRARRRAKAKKEKEELSAPTAVLEVTGTASSILALAFAVAQVAGNLFSSIVIKSDRKLKS
jgi:hypothetical protein